MLTRPCPADASIAAAALYLQATAIDLESEFTRISRALASTSITAAIVQRVTANYNTFATATVGQDLFLTNTTIDVFKPADEDAGGLWMFGFSVLCNPSGADTAGSVRNMILSATYDDTLGSPVTMGTVRDTVFEAGDAPINRMNAANSFVVPSDLGVFPDFPSFFTHGNVASQITIMAGTMMWAFRVGPNAQIATVS